jgi:hypothetical protein
MSESVQRMLNSDGKSACSSFVGLVPSDRERKSRQPVPKKHLGRTTFQLEKCWQLFIAGRIEAFRFRTGLDFNLPDW